MKIFTKLKGQLPVLKGETEDQTCSDVAGWVVPPRPLMLLLMSSYIWVILWSVWWFNVFSEWVERSQHLWVPTPTRSLQHKHPLWKLSYILGVFSLSEDLLPEPPSPDLSLLLPRWQTSVRPQAPGLTGTLEMTW